MSTVASALSGIRTLHGHQTPPLGRQPAARRQSRPLSGPQRAFQTGGCTPGYPPKIRIGARQRRFFSAGPFRSAEPASASTAIERARERSLGRCSEPTTAPGHRATGRFRGSSGSRSTFAPATSALGPLHDPTTGYAGSPARHTLRRSVVGGSGGGWATCRAAGSLPAGGN